MPPGRGRFQAAPDPKSGRSNRVVHAVPELFRTVLEGADLTLWHAARALPYALWALEQLLVAHDVREHLAALDPSGPEPPPASGLLPAITRAACGRAFSLERLGVLGDAFLKWETSCQLYEAHANWSEGDLSQLRAQVHQQAKPKPKPFSPPLPPPPPPALSLPQGSGTPLPSLLPPLLLLQLLLLRQQQQQQQQPFSPVAWIPCLLLPLLPIAPCCVSLPPSP